MTTIRKQNKLMITGAMIVLGALLIWSLGFELYIRNAERHETICEDISMVTLDLDNTVLTIERSESDDVSYSFTRSRNIEWTMYGRELRLSARGGILTLRIPEDMDIETLEVRNSKEATFIYDVEAAQIRVTTDGLLSMQDVEASRARLEIASGDIVSSGFGKLLAIVRGKLDMTETDAGEISLFLKDQDATILGGEIGSIDASSTEGDLEIEPENGIFSVSVTGGASAIFINEEALPSKSYSNPDNREGSEITFNSPKGSVRTC